MQRRLLYAGMRPISNIVDITNFVMLEWGQPLHAFDYDVLVERAGGKAPTIIVRPARDGEVLVTLDKQERKLSPEHLVIADTKGPIALAGVMGGLEAEVAGHTKNILLESASFDFVSIRRTFRHFDLPSEASARFSRGIHPETVKPAAERAADLMRQYAGGSVCQGLVDCYPAPRPPQVVEFKTEQMDRLLGFKIEPSEALRILRALEYKVEPAGPSVNPGSHAPAWEPAVPTPERGNEVWLVGVPTHRLDVQDGAADLVEDIVRIYGYDRIPLSLLSEPLPKQQANEQIVFEEKVRDILVDCGLQEVVCYALTVPQKEAPLLDIDPEKYVRLKNPISSERVVMRQSVLASVLEIAENNLRHTDDVRLFEAGFAYVPKAGQPLPDEPRRLAIVMTGNRGQEFWDGGGPSEPRPSGSGKRAALDFFELKGVIEALTEDLHLRDTKYQPAKAAYLHPGKAATLLAADKVIGDFGVLHPKVAQQYGLGERTVLVAEFDVEALQAATPIRFSYAPVPRFPAALRDIAVVVDEKIPAAQIETEIRKAGGDLLSGVRLFDLYRGNQIPAGTKSLAYALSYQAPDRTLADKEIDKAHKKIEDRLKQALKATIRGKD
jgi:phenylalanyl-tRNA synthetase beta chain